MAAEIVSFLWTLVWSPAFIFKYGTPFKGRKDGHIEGYWRDESTEKVHGGGGGWVVPEP